MKSTARKHSAGAPRFRGGPGKARLVPVLAGAVLLAGLLAGCSTGSGAVDVNNGAEFRFVAGTPAGEVIPPDQRATAPQFSGTLLETGEKLPSSQLTDQVVVLNFWGSWCAPCRVETPAFSEVWKDYSAAGVQFLGVDVKETDRQFAKAFIDRFGIGFPSLYDPRGEVALAFRDFPANAIPSTIVLDPQWRVAAVYTGSVSTDDLRGVIDRVLGEE